MLIKLGEATFNTDHIVAFRPSENDITIVYLSHEKEGRTVRLDAPDVEKLELFLTTQGRVDLDKDFPEEAFRRAAELAGEIQKRATLLQIAELKRKVAQLDAAVDAALMAAAGTSVNQLASPVGGPVMSAEDPRVLTENYPAVDDEPSPLQFVKPRGNIRHPFSDL